MAWGLNMGLLIRILGRYAVGALAGLLAYAGLPPAVVDAIHNDPEIAALVALGVAGVIEWATVVARRAGWLT